MLKQPVSVYNIYCLDSGQYWCLLFSTECSTGVYRFIQRSMRMFVVLCSMPYRHLLFYTACSTGVLLFVEHALRVFIPLYSMQYWCLLFYTVCSTGITGCTLNCNANYTQCSMCDPGYKPTSASGTPITACTCMYKSINQSTDQSVKQFD